MQTLDLVRAHIDDDRLCFYDSTQGNRQNAFCTLKLYSPRSCASTSEWSDWLRPEQRPNACSVGNYVGQEMPLKRSVCGWDGTHAARCRWASGTAPAAGASCADSATLSGWCRPATRRTPILLLRASTAPPRAAAVRSSARAPCCCATSGAQQAFQRSGCRLVSFLNLSEPIIGFGHAELS